MFQISTFAVSWECSCSVPRLGKFWGHCKHMPGKLQNLEHLKCACSVPRISPDFPTSGTLQEHSQDIANVLIWNIFGTSLWFFSNFPSLVHCDHTDGNTAKSLQMSHSGTSLVPSLANLKVYPQFTQWEHHSHMTWNTANVLAVFLDCDIWVHHQYFFGNIHSFPVDYLMGP